MQVERAAPSGVAPVVIAHPRAVSLDVNGFAPAAEPLGVLRSVRADDDTIRRTVSDVTPATALILLSRSAAIRWCALGGVGGLDSAGGEPCCTWRGAAGPVPIANPRDGLAVLVRRY